MHCTSGGILIILFLFLLCLVYFVYVISGTLRSRNENHSRPSLEQVVAIVDFMEKHPALALGQLRGLEGRDESKKLWFELTRIVNNISGPTRPMKSWIKYWADKKSSVRSKVLAIDGDPNGLSSNVEKKIWDLFLANDSPPKSRRTSVKQESHYAEETFFGDGTEQNQDKEPVLGFEDSAMDTEDRQMAIMEKLVTVMSAQSSSLSQLAHAAAAGSQAMDRLAEASMIQAHAIERLATTLESAGAASRDARAALRDIDATVKRFYTASPT
ncbi:uncharacterized protein LOC128676323 isoform X3 [Plodia interpunctella]|uniref:uncharacterized protein LOC128676323 isoform X3 n=1 Tax=Plodia interpunctella TaxID=58824 RepID=UPI002368109B|nr:uncharacterized protein LOC128676323 isoform X4 [Plodia interpunctella]